MNTYTNKERNMFLTGMAGLGAMNAVITTGILYYFQSVLCIPALAISAITSISIIWDGLNDPLTGTILDRTRSKWGKLRPYLMFGPIFLMVVTILPYLNGQWSESNSATKNAWIIVWAGVTYILWGTIHEFVAVPYNSMPSRMTGDEKQRTKLATTAVVFNCVANLAISYIFIAVAQAIGNVFTAKGATHGDGMQYGFIVFAVLVTVITYPILQCGAYAKERIPTLSEEKRGFVGTIKVLWTCKPYRRIFISGLLGSLCSFGMSNVTFIIYYFGDNGGNGQSHLLHTLLIYGTSFGCDYVGRFLAIKIFDKMEKKKARILFALGGLIGPIGMLVAYLIDGTSLYKWYWVAYLMLVLGLGSLCSGIANAASNLMSFECIDYEEYHTGYRPEGAIFGAASFLNKLTSSIPAFLQGVIFTIVGFSGEGLRAINEALAVSPKEDYYFATAPEFAAIRFAMFFLLTIPAICATLIGLIPMFKYEITGEYHKKILAELQARREAAGK